MQPLHSNKNAKKTPPIVPYLMSKSQMNQDGWIIQDRVRWAMLLTSLWENSLKPHLFSCFTCAFQLAFSFIHPQKHPWILSSKCGILWYMQRYSFSDSAETLHLIFEWKFYQVEVSTGQPVNCFQFTEGCKVANSFIISNRSVSTSKCWFTTQKVSQPTSL